MKRRLEGETELEGNSSLQQDVPQFSCKAINDDKHHMTTKKHHLTGTKRSVVV